MARQRGTKGSGKAGAGRGRTRNTVPTAELKLSTTDQVVAYLEKLARTGMFGKNPSEVAEQLLREKLREIYDLREIVGRPPDRDG